MERPFLLLAFLFCFQSWGIASFKGSCESVFEDSTDSQENNNKFPHLLKDKPYSNKVNNSPKNLQSKSNKNPQSLINSIPHTYSSLDSNQIKGSLSQKWKEQVLGSLPQFSAAQLLSLFVKLAGLSNKLDLQGEREFFKLLEKASITHMADFNKEQLVDIIWAFTRLDIKSPKQKFVRGWRESALKQRGHFESIDRYILRGWFQQLEIPTQEAMAAGK